MPWRSLGSRIGFARDKQMSQAWLFLGVPVVPVFPATVKFSTTRISPTTTAWASSASAVSLGHVLFYLMFLCALCWLLWGSKATAFLCSGIFILFHPFLFMCDSFLVSVSLHFPGGFLFVAVLWRINPRIFCFSFFLPKRTALSILLVPTATELCAKLALEHLLKVVL